MPKNFEFNSLFEFHCRDVLDPTKVLNCLMSIEPDENEVLHPKIKYMVCKCEKRNSVINVFWELANCHFLSLHITSYTICHWIRQHFSWNWANINWANHIHGHRICVVWILSPVQSRHRQQQQLRRRHQRQHRQVYQMMFLHKKWYHRLLTKCTAA